MERDPASERREANRRAFAVQSEDFESRGWVFTDASVLAWIEASISPSPEDRVLDVAGGTGALGRHLGRKARATVICDLTPEMLVAGAAAAREEGRTDVVYVRGDAAELPFVDDQFDLVVSRFALHHMNDAAAVLAEMARVCRPGGIVGVIDMVAAEGPEGERHNELERLRDPSHSTTLTEVELRRAIMGAGIEIATEAERVQPMDAPRWIAQARSGSEVTTELERAFREETAGGPATGLRAAELDGVLTISQRWLLLAGPAPKHG